MTTDHAALDFARSSLTWLLAEPPSYGRFTVDAALTIGREAPEQYVLGSQVLAGNVYSSGPLFKDPPYGFAMALGASRYRIFRDAVRGRPAEDTVGRIEDGFVEAKADLARRACRRIDIADLARRPFIRTDGLSARIKIEAGADGRRRELEFPVRHVNVDPRSRRFQVETGPILVDWGSEDDAPACLRRAYVMFASMSRAEFLFDADRPAGPGGGWNRRVVSACEISLMEAEESWTATKPA